MRLDLLWWRHLRGPRPHVAEYPIDFGAHVVDMTKFLTALEINSAPFTEMIKKISGARETDVPQHSHFDVPVGTVVRDVENSMAYTVTANELANPNDWFDTTRRITMQRKTTGFDVKHFWMEDQLFPRLKETA